MKLWKVLVLLPYPLILVFALVISSGLATEAGFVGVIVGVAFFTYGLFWMSVYTCVLGVALAIRWAVLKRRAR
jgi:hypothetical protein